MNSSHRELRLARTVVTYEEIKKTWKNRVIGKTRWAHSHLLVLDFACMPRELILYNREDHIVKDTSREMYVCMHAVLLLDVNSPLQEVPICDQCLDKGDVAGIIKPDIVFFGEGLPAEFHHQIHSDKGKVCVCVHDTL